MRPLLILLWLPQMAFASGSDNDSCADTWERFFDGQNEVQYRTSSVPVFGRSLQRAPTPTVVASCSVGEENSSGVLEWTGYAQLDVTGTAQVVGTCTAIDVVEVFGKAQDRCRRFSDARLCRNVDDPSLVSIKRGESEDVRCPGD
jgi:hypothetical protein